MYIHHEKKVAFIAHPRTASTATAHVLMQMGFVIEDSHHSCPTWDLDGWDVICTVRNPFDVLVSWFYNQPREKPFTQWLPEFLDGCSFMQGERMFFGQPICNHVMYYENLQDDFEYVMNAVGLPMVKIPRRNVSVNRGERSFMGYYNPRTSRMVIERFHRDFVCNSHVYPVRKL